jgi:hypothetical protein
MTIGVQQSDYWLLNVMLEQIDLRREIPLCSLGHCPASADR